MLENRAAALGPSKFPWWKDWRGECVAIIASGPSTKTANLALLRDRIHVIAIKKNVELCPWADVVYGCDAAWWRSVKGLPDFKGLKLVYDGASVPGLPGLQKIGIEAIQGHATPEKYKRADRILVDVPGYVGNGGNSGFQALNIAVQFGATGIALIGFDNTDRGGVHWYGRNNWSMGGNPSQTNFDRWDKACAAAVPDLAALGVDVVNCSRDSALKMFPKMTIEAALSRWGL